MQSLNSTPMINASGVTVSGINIIPSTTGVNVGQPVTVSAVANHTTHQLTQPTNIQLIIATKSLPQAVPVATAQVATPVAVKQDVISIPVSATPMAVKQEMIAVPVVSQQGGTTTMMVVPSMINNQIITTSNSTGNTNVITTNLANTVTVTGQTPGLDLLACLECGKHFVSVAKLKSHEKTHSKSRPFKCIDCNKSFTVRYSLICHTRTHTRERPYQCSQCGSRFTQASSLKTHQIYKHTKNFPYACKQCDRGFISPGQRHEHVVRTHLKMPGSLSTRSKSKSKSKSSANSNSQQQAQQQQQQQQQQVHEQTVATVATVNSTNTIPNNTNQLNLTMVNTSSANNLTTINQGDNNTGNTVTLVNAHILQPSDASTQIQSGGIDTDQLPPGSTITLAIQAISAPDSDDSLGPSMSSAACQTALSLPPLL